MKLHYSQTTFPNVLRLTVLLVPYEITLLSNQYVYDVNGKNVLVPYEITLLSNLMISI